MKNNLSPNHPFLSLSLSVSRESVQVSRGQGQLIRPAKEKKVQRRRAPPQVNLATTGGKQSEGLTRRKANI